MSHPITVSRFQCQLILPLHHSAADTQFVAHIKLKSLVNMRFYGFVLVGFYYLYKVTECSPSCCFLLMALISDICEVARIQRHSR